MNSARPHCWLDKQLKDIGNGSIKAMASISSFLSTATKKSTVQQLSLWPFPSWSKILKGRDMSFGNLSRMVFSWKSEQSILEKKIRKCLSVNIFSRSLKQYLWYPGILPLRLCWPVNFCAFEDWNICGKTCKLYLQVWSRALMEVPQLAYDTLFSSYIRLKRTLSASLEHCNLFGRLFLYHLPVQFTLYFVCKLLKLLWW